MAPKPPWLRGMRDRPEPGTSGSFSYGSVCGLSVGNLDRSTPPAPQASEITIAPAHARTVFNERGIGSTSASNAVSSRFLAGQPAKLVHPQGPGEGQADDTGWDSRATKKELAVESRDVRHRDLSGGA